MSAPPVSYVIPFPTRNTVFFTSPTHNTDRYMERQREERGADIQIQRKGGYRVTVVVEKFRCKKTKNTYKRPKPE
jgi:hypothetical protein